MVFKKILCFVLSIAIIFLTACSAEEQNNNENFEESDEGQLNFCGVWLSCYELADMLKSGSEEVYRAEVKAVAEHCKDKGIKSVFLQVRPFADSVYSSKIFPLSEYIRSSSGDYPDFDVLEIFIETARDYSLEVHAWINPYRISYKTDINAPDISAIAKSSDYISGVVCTDAGIYFNPCVVENQSLVLSGVREILENYDVDGIHIDDYFYPLTDDEFDKTDYESYRDCGGKLSFAQWRRENVNSLVSSLYSLVHSYGDDLVFSISPAGDIKKNYSSYYADVELWLMSDGFADVIIPQLYYGFEHEKMPFERVADKWERLDRSDNVKLVCGLASYKQGAEDELAGKGRREWIENSNIIERQIAYLKSTEYCGYVLFSYKNIL